MNDHLGGRAGKAYIWVRYAQMCTVKTMTTRIVHPVNALTRRLIRRWSRIKPMMIDPIICAVQYTTLFSERARILNTASLYSLNSVRVCKRKGSKCERLPHARCKTNLTQKTWGKAVKSLDLFWGSPIIRKTQLSMMDVEELWRNSHQSLSFWWGPPSITVLVQLSVSGWGKWS